MTTDFLDLLRQFNADGVRYLVVGAYALAAHGHPRATGDLDVWVEATPDNARLAFEALAAFGAPLDRIRPVGLSSPDVVVQFGIPPRRVDVLSSISGVAFADAWRGRMTTRVGDVKLPVIGRKDLVTNKRAAGPPKDLLDADLLDS